MSATETREDGRTQQTPPSLQHCFPPAGWSGRPDGIGDIAHCGHRRTKPWDGRTVGNSQPPAHLCMVCASMEGLS